LLNIVCILSLKRRARWACLQQRGRAEARLA
jgi:hypothetical protein